MDRKFKLFLIQHYYKVHKKVSFKKRVCKIFVESMSEKRIRTFEKTIEHNLLESTL